MVNKRDSGEVLGVDDEFVRAGDLGTDLDIVHIMRIERKEIASRLNRLVLKYNRFFGLFNRDFRKTKRLPPKDSALLDDIALSLSALSGYCMEHRLPIFNSHIAELKFKLHDFYKRLGYGQRKPVYAEQD